jgi:hypothetical protein
VDAEDVNEREPIQTDLEWSRNKSGASSDLDQMGRRPGGHDGGLLKL